MDILLTKDSSEIQAIVIGLEYGRISTDHDVIQAAIEEACRAQVRKDSDWMVRQIRLWAKGHSEGTRSYRTCVELADHVEKALRAAGGEEK